MKIKIKQVVLRCLPIVLAFTGILMINAFAKASPSILPYEEAHSPSPDWEEAPPDSSDPDRKFLRWWLDMSQLNTNGDDAKIHVEVVWFDSDYNEHIVTSMDTLIDCTLHNGAYVGNQTLYLDTTGYASCELPSIQDIGYQLDPTLQLGGMGSNPFIEFNPADYGANPSGTLFAHPDFGLAFLHDQYIFEMDEQVWAESTLNKPTITAGHFCYESGIPYVAGSECYIEEIVSGGSPFQMGSAPATVPMNLDTTVIYIGCSPTSFTSGAACHPESFLGGRVPLSDGDNFLSIDPLAHPPGGSL